VEAVFDCVFETSKLSSMPDGGATVPSALFPYQPSTSDPSADVVSEGAAISFVFALYWPSAASTGLDSATPAKSVTPAVAPTDDENCHVYTDGSNAETTLTYSVWLNAAPPMLLSRLISLQPSGAVIDPLGERRAVTTATSTSPWIEPGFATVIELARDVRAVVLALTVIVPSPPDGTNPGSSATNVRAKAGAADTAKSAMQMTATRAANPGRGRLPNMRPASAILELR
jgi:hypothetical protein